MFKNLKWFIVLLLLSALESSATFSVPDRRPDIPSRSISSPTSHPTFVYFALFVVSSSSDPSGSLQGAGGVGGLIATVLGGDPEPVEGYALFDANGNIVQYIDDEGNIVAAREYSPFGETTSVTGSMQDDFTFWFSTKYWDTETGLGYWGMRYYHPDLGRWLSRDPLGEEGGLLLYGFVGNDPVGGVDLLGMDYITVSDTGEVIWVVQKDGWFNTDSGRLSLGVLPRGSSSVTIGAKFGGGTVPLRGLSKTVSMFWEREDAGTIMSPADISGLDEEGQVSEIKWFLDKYLNPRGETRLSSSKGLLCSRLTRRLDKAQAFGDWLGMTPWIGNPIDVINTVVYGARGKWRDFGYGFAAMVPAIGQGATLTKWGSRGDDFLTFYHATSKQGAASIRKRGIDLAFSRGRTDFGRGFYTTTRRSQAFDWASSRFKEAGEVLEFKVSRDALENLDVLDMGAKTRSSLGRFFRHNRLGGRLHGYDAVSGPMLGNPGAFLGGSAPHIFGEQTSFHSQEALELLLGGLQ